MTKRIGRSESGCSTKVIVSGFVDSVTVATGFPKLEKSPLAW